MTRQDAEFGNKNMEFEMRELATAIAELFLIFFYFIFLLYLTKFVLYFFVLTVIGAVLRNLLVISEDIFSSSKQ